MSNEENKIEEGNVVKGKRGRKPNSERPKSPEPQSIISELAIPVNYEYCYSRTATVQVNNFEPQNAFCSQKIVKAEEITQEDRDNLRKIVDTEINKDLKRLNNLKNGITEEETKKTVPIDNSKIYIPKKCQDLSMKFSKGRFLISVTSILSYLYPIQFPQEYLEVYGARGTLVHETWEKCIKENISIMPSELDPEKNAEIKSKVMTGKINGNVWTKSIDADECNPAGFLAEYGKDFEFTNLEKDVSNYDLGFYGRYDFGGKYQGKNCIGDIKSHSPSKDKIEKAFKQMAAYSLCEGNEDVECLVYIALNPKKKCGYDAPVVTEDLKKYQEMFLEDLAKFKKDIEVVYV